MSDDRLDDGDDREPPRVGAAGRQRIGSGEHAPEIVRLRYEDDLLPPEIAARLGSSQMRVSRVLRASLGKRAA